MTITHFGNCLTGAPRTADRARLVEKYCTLCIPDVDHAAANLRSAKWYGKCYNFAICHSWILIARYS